MRNESDTFTQTVHRYETIDRTAEENNSLLKESIACIVGRGTQADERAAGMEAAARLTQDERNDKQEKTIETFARKRSVWIENTNLYFSRCYGESINKGEGNQEADVYLKDGWTIIKSKNTYQYTDLLEALWSIKTHNSFFPETALTLVGFGRNAEGDFVLIVEQPFVKIGRMLTREEIDDFMHNEFPYLGNDEEIPLRGRYTDGIIHINDLHEANVAQLDNGDIVVIDSINRYTNYNALREYVEQNNQQVMPH